MDLISRKYYNLLTEDDDYAIKLLNRRDYKLHNGFNKTYNIRIHKLNDDIAMSPGDFKYTGYQEPFNNIPKRINK